MKPMSDSMSALRFASLICALVLYAALSSPTPDSPGLVEGVIGILLCIAAAPGLIRVVVLSTRGQAVLWQRMALFALTYSLTLPTLGGILANNAAPALLRDLVATAYLFLPLFTADLFIGNTRRTTFLAVTAIAMGCLFALRTALQDYDAMIAHLLAPAITLNTGELTYLANAPTLLWAAGAGYALFCKHITCKPVSAVTAMAAAILCITAMALTLQRASLGAWLFIVIVTHISLLRTAPLRSLCLSAILLGCTLSLSALTAPVLDVAIALYEKTQIHGGNMRVQEWQAVLSRVNDNAFSLLFGQGWGAGFYSPATDGAYVTFTHGLISATLFKAGLFGLLCIGLYLCAVLMKLYPVLRATPAIALSLLCPVLIDITLYGAYKSLDFGVMLLLAVGVASTGERIFGGELRPSRHADIEIAPQPL